MTESDKPTESAAAADYEWPPGFGREDKPLWDEKTSIAFGQWAKGCRQHNIRNAIRSGEHIDSSITLGRNRAEMLRALINGEYGTEAAYVRRLNDDHNRHAALTAARGTLHALIARRAAGDDHGET